MSSRSERYLANAEKCQPFRWSVYSRRVGRGRRGCRMGLSPDEGPNATIPGGFCPNCSAGR